jgi:hypothetical protein
VITHPLFIWSLVQLSMTDPNVLILTSILSKIVSPKMKSQHRLTESLRASSSCSVSALSLLQPKLRILNAHIPPIWGEVFKINVSVCVCLN